MVRNWLIDSLLRAILLLGVPLTLLVSADARGDDGTRPAPSTEQPQATNATAPSRGGDVISAPASNAGNRWALIIGINYDPPATAKPNPKRLTKLAHAEADAQAVFEMLQENYGFEPDRIKLLKGREATRENIMKMTAEGLLCRTKGEKSGGDGVRPEDSIVLFFAGHGLRHDLANGGEVSYLVPADVEYDEEGNIPPNSSKLIDLRSDIVSKLDKGCPAGQKLLILDSCYSGGVHGAYSPLRAPIEREAGTLDAFRSAEPGPRAKAFQALTASNDKASDGVGEHSPFTTVLLEAMKNLPHYSSFRKQFDASHLFHAMKSEFGRSVPGRQSPQFGWLDAESLGEYSFFPRDNFPQDEVSAQQIRMCLQAMVPGSFGNWWFEEVPWFMPGLRYQILKDAPQSRSNELESIGRLKLLDAAHRTMQRMAVDDQPLIKLRLDMLGHFLDRKNLAESRDEALRRCLNMLEQEDGSPRTIDNVNLDAVDLHYRAVLRQGLGRKKYGAGNAPSEEDIRRGIRLAYDEALEKYDEELKGPDAKGQMSFVTQPKEALRALCLTDRGFFALRFEKDYEQAVADFSRALDSLALKGPAPFRIYGLTSLADAQLAQDKWGVADKVLQEALVVCREVDPAGIHPLSATLHSKIGWMRMQRFQVDEAWNEFAAANMILKDKSDIEARLALFHNIHGQAMASRFAGDSASAVKIYRELLTQISSLSERLRTQSEEESHFSDVRGQVRERWVNSMERLGDCHLFGDPSDFEEAADEYRRAMRACVAMPLERRLAYEAKLYRKWALALCMSAAEKFRPSSPRGESATPGEPAAESSRRARKDLAWAEHYLREADKFVAMAASKQDKQSESAASTKLPRTTVLEADDLLKKLVESVLAEVKADIPEHQKPSGDRTPPEVRDSSDAKRLPSPAEEEGFKEAKTNELRDLIEKRYSERSLTKYLPRDELEYLLFASGFLVSRRDSQDLTRYSDSQTLLGLCRMARSRKGETLRYLRRYYDTAIQAQLELGPANSKELIEIVWESTHGQVYRKPAERLPILAYYAIGKDAYMFLDLPQRALAPFKLPPGYDTVAVKKAMESGTPRIRLPLAIREELEPLEAPASGKLEVRWRDPVAKLGCTNSFDEGFRKLVGSLPGPSPSGSGPSRESTEGVGGYFETSLVVAVPSIGHTTSPAGNPTSSSGSKPASPTLVNDTGGNFPFHVGELQVIEQAPNSQNALEPGLASANRDD